MDIQKQIQAYLATQPEPKRSDLQALHHLILAMMPTCRLWFLDGKDETGKTVSNPNIGYGFQTLEQAKGRKKDFYQIGLSPNTTGVSVYIIGLKDKHHLVRNFGKTIGKASVTGYCIKFKTLKEIHINVLEAAIKDGIELTRAQP